MVVTFLEADAFTVRTAWKRACFCTNAAHTHPDGHLSSFKPGFRGEGWAKDDSLMGTRS